jgi:hypothetical protein
VTTRDGLVVIGQFVVTVLAAVIGLALGTLTFVLDVVAIAGCAICDNTPPNYIAATVMTAVCLLLEWIIFVAWRATCTNERYGRDI